jgi:hypothetical protein
MKKRPVSVTLIGLLFIAAGIIGLIYHAIDRGTRPLFDSEIILVLGIRLLAILGGVFALRGANWARWMLVCWIGYHAILSAFQTLPELAIHTTLFLLVVYFLFRSPAMAYFRGGN